MLEIGTVVAAIFLGLVGILLLPILCRWILILARKIFSLTVDLFGIESRAAGEMAAAFFWTGIGMCVIVYFITTWRDKFLKNARINFLRFILKDVSYS